MPSFVSAGTLLAVTTQNGNVVAPTCQAGDILICQVISKSLAIAITMPGFDGELGTQADTDCVTAADDHRPALFWKRATAADSGASFAVNRASSPTTLLAAIISVWRGCPTGGSPFDPTAVGIQRNTAAADTVTFPAFDPTAPNGPTNPVHVAFFAFYGNDLTTFGAAMSADTNPDCTTRYDQETSTGTDATLACTSGDSDGSNIASRTWASASTTDAGSTAYVIGFLGVAPKPVVVAAPSHPRGARARRTRSRAYPIIRAAGLVPADTTVALTPSPVAAAFTTTAPSVVKGTRTLTPSPVSAAFSAVTPTVGQSAVARPAQPIIASGRGRRARGRIRRRSFPILRAAALVPATASGTLTPSPVTAAFTATTPAVVRGSRTLAPGAVSAVFAAVTPAVVRGARVLATAAVAAVFAVVTPSVGGVTTVTPSAVPAAFSVAAPTIVQGAVAKRAQPVIAIGDGRQARARRRARPIIRAAGLVVYGAQAVAPSPVAAAFTVPAPTVVRGAKTVTPSPTSASFTVTTPTVVRQGLLTPAPVAAAFTVAAPTIVQPGGAVRRRSVFVISGRQRARREDLRRRSLALHIAIAYQAGSTTQFRNPNPVAAAFTVTAPIVVKGSRTVAPSPIAASFSATTPVVFRPGLLTPAPVAASFTAPTPIVVKGGVTRTTSPVAAVFAVQAPTLSTARIVAPPAIAAAFTVTTPAIVKGGVTKTPSPVAAAFTVRAPTLSTARIVAPAPVVAVLTARSPAIPGGAITRTPTPVVAAFTVTTPVVLSNILLAIKHASNLLPLVIVRDVLPPVLVRDLQPRVIVREELTHD